MALNRKSNWQGSQTVEQRQFTCGHSGCGREVASNIGWFCTNPNTGMPEGYLYICPMCHYTTLFDDSVAPAAQIPGVSFGKVVEHLPEDIDDLYGEIRKATSARAYTSAVLSCRKILMHIAVEKGAAENKAFAFYIKYLADNHYAPPGSEAWVTKIKDSGNEANHEIKIMTKDEAEELVNFVQMLLTFIYEFPKKIGTPQPTPATPQRAPIIPA